MSDPSRSLHLRPATIDDIALLRLWDDEPAVVESDPNDDRAWETELLRSPPWREQLIAEVDGRAIGFVQINDPALEESHYWGDVPAHLRAVDLRIGEARRVVAGMAARRCGRHWRAVSRTRTWRRC